MQGRRSTERQLGQEKPGLTREFGKGRKGFLKNFTVCLHLFRALFHLLQPYLHQSV